MNDSLPPGFKIIDGAVRDCKSVIEWLDTKCEFQRSQIVNEIVSDIRTSTTAGFPFLDFENPPYIHEMNRIVWQELDKYAKEYNFGFTGVEAVSVQRYQPGQEYKVHSDAGIGIPRVVSALVYLNTVEEGGETYFPLFDVKITPIEGRLVIFPASYPYAHAALPPTKGVKYAAAFWARG